MDMKQILYIVAAYSLIIGISEFVSNASSNSPVFDTVAGLPSAGSLLAKTGTPNTMAGIDIAASVAAFIAARIV